MYKNQLNDSTAQGYFWKVGISSVGIKFLDFLESKISLLCSQQTATEPSPEPVQPNLHRHMNFDLLVSSFPCIVLRSGLFPSGYSKWNIVRIFISIRAACPTHTILVYLTTLTILTLPRLSCVPPCCKNTLNNYEDNCLLGYCAM
jgi:hypothetical protein